MKKQTTLIILVFLLIFCSHSWAQKHTNGYYKQNGTYVQPHYSTSPNSSRSDNWSTRGNVNPYTGKSGYRDPYHSSPNQLTPRQPRSRPLPPGGLL